MRGSMGGPGDSVTRQCKNVTSKIWTTDELEQMTPAQRHELFEASVITDIDQAPAQLLARTRARIEPLITDTERAQPG